MSGSDSHPEISPRAAGSWGRRGIDSLFGEAQVAPAPWRQISRRRSHADYDIAALSEVLGRPPVLTEIDPHGLRSTRPSLTRPGVSYYLTPRYSETGRTFADYEQVVNRFPVVYRREDGEDLIISGHHRAAAALLQGRQLSARLVEGPWGPPRTDSAPSLESAAKLPAKRERDEAATSFLTPLLTVGARPSWPHELVTGQNQDVVKIILDGTRCHLKISGRPVDHARVVQRYLVELGLSPVDAAAQAQFARTGDLRLDDSRGAAAGRDRDGGSIAELSVHLPCARIRGPLPLSFVGDEPDAHRWQHCSCGGPVEKWPYTDVSRLYELCVLCQRGVAGGVSRYSWVACRFCRNVNNTFGSAVGHNPLPLGRHSLMNGIRVKSGNVGRDAARAFREFSKMMDGHEGLYGWQKGEVQRMAESRGWESQEVVPLTVWQNTFIASTDASKEAFRRYTGFDPISLRRN